MRVAHLTSVHTRFDTRIFLKMCRSLASHGYDVTLVVADGCGHQYVDDIRIIDVGKPKNRLTRIISTTKSIFNISLKLNVDLYHIHDPELIPFGIKLKKLGKKVIFDSHEDVPKQIIGRVYLNRFLLYLIAFAFKYYERYACRKFDAVISATPFIEKKFSYINKKSVVINNYPLLDEFNFTADNLKKSMEICYVGYVCINRGILEIIEAMNIIKDDIKLNICGRFSEDYAYQKSTSMQGWLKVNHFGHVNRSIVSSILSKSFAGLVTFHPLPNHLDAQPNKMYEYMSAGIPVIASDFPLWRNIIENENCGLLVDPCIPSQIASAIKFFIDNPLIAKEMGLNGRKAIIERFNWENEFFKLIGLYKDLLI